MRRLLAVGGIALAVLAAGLGWSQASARSSGPQTVVLAMRHSKFIPAVVEVKAGTTVRFVVDNLDPIDHEFIVGSAAVHDRHEKGTEAHHGARPGEVSVAAGEMATTTFTFPKAGSVVFGCHLPGHWDYGMQGVVRVR